MCNADIKKTAKQAGVFLYAVAKELGISESTMTRLLRYELPDEKKTEIKDIIAELKEQKSNGKGIQ